MTNGFSSKVARFFRAFHRHSHDGDVPTDTSSVLSVSSSSSPSAHALLLLTAGARSPPKHTRLPSGFTRHVRNLVDNVSKLRATPTSSASATARRHASVAKALDRITQLLKARDDNDQHAMRVVPLNVALEQLVTVWECVLQCLDLSRAVTVPGASPSSIERLSTASSASSSSADDSTRLETAGRRLLALLVHQREFDAALMALGRGECNVHQNDGTRKRSTHDGSRPDELLVSLRLSRRNSVTIKRAPVPRPLPSKRDVSKTSDAPLCVLTKKYLDLHQTTLRLLQDAYTQSGDCLDDRNGQDPLSDRALLMQFLAISYVRVPAIRGTMLESFQDFIGSSNGRRRRLLVRQQRRQRSSTSTAKAAAFARGRSVTVIDEVNVALFRWTEKLSSKCHGCVTPYHRDGYWVRETRRLELAMQGNVKFQRVLLAQLIEHFMTIGGTGGIDWKCLLGATVLKEALLTMTESVFVAQLHAAEKSALEKQDAITGAENEGSSLKSQTELSSQSFALSTPDDWTVGLFLKQTMRILADNNIFIYDWMMTILNNTNSMVSYHVTLCLRYLSQLMTEFPAYFTNDSGATSTTLLQIFTQLLKSDHFEILRNTEMFLMKHFAGFSITLRESLVQIFAVEFKHLFLHWNRDVRFCYYHMLLYLTYPGNRLVLGAKSDELLMGAEAAYLFEIPGLVRHSTSTMAMQWSAIDAPLCELITYVHRTTKHASLKSSSTSTHSSSMGAMIKPRRLERDAPTSRTSMTLRPRPSASRSSLSTRPGQYGRASLSAMPASGRVSTNRSSLSTNRASLASSMDHVSTGRAPYTSTSREALSSSMGPSTSSIAAPPKSAPSVMQQPPPPAWIQALALSTMQRSVQEYRRHVEDYFSFAQQISIHEPVPTPMLQTAKA